MFKILRLNGWLVFLVSFFQISPLCPVYAQPQGSVDYALQWGSSQQTYTYIFSGIVTCQGHPCANARVEVAFETENHGTLNETAVAGVDGQYNLKVSLQAPAEESATWKLVAKASMVGGGDPAEVEGRVIMMQDEPTVVVERPLLIQQG